MYHENSIQKRIGMEILISGKIDFKTKIVSRGEEGDFIIIVIRSIIQGDSTIINIYTPKNRPPPYM